MRAESHGSGGKAGIGFSTRSPALRFWWKGGIVGTRPHVLFTAEEAKAIGSTSCTDGFVAVRLTMSRLVAAGAFADTLFGRV